MVIKFRQMGGNIEFEYSGELDEPIIFPAPRGLRTPREIKTYAKEFELGEVYPHIFLDDGELPFGPPPEVEDMFRRYFEAGDVIRDATHYPKREYRIDNTEGENGVKERFGLDDSVKVIITPGGSQAILERFVTNLFLKGNLDVNYLSPTFLEFHMFLEQHMPSSVKQIIPDIRSRTRDTVPLVREELSKRDQERRQILYVCSPTTPAGDTFDYRTHEYFAYEMAMRGGYYLVDEAAADTVDDHNSAVHLIKDFPNVIVTRSCSKAIGLPGLGIGYAMMSQAEGRKFEKALPTYYKRGNLMAMRLANQILNPEILLPHLENVQMKVTELKSELIDTIDEELEKYETPPLEVIPTGTTTPTLAIKARRPTFYSNVLSQGLAVVDGGDFGPTHPGYDSSIIRINIPSKREDIPIVVRRLFTASLAA